MRGGGDRRPDVRKVELGGNEVRSVRFETATRGAIGREDVGKGGETRSLVYFVVSIVVAPSVLGFSTILLKCNAQDRPNFDRAVSQRQSRRIIMLEEESDADAIVSSYSRVNTWLVTEA